jgi:Putative peptidoglycan binding domain
VPKRISDDDEMPRRRRGARAVAIESERGLLIRVLLHSPKDTFAGAMAFATVVAIIVNALFLQTGHHPAPMFGSVVVMPQAAALTPANPLPRPRPVEADAAPAEAKPVVEAKPAPEPRLALESKPAPEPKLAPEPKPADPKTAEPKSAELKPADPLGNLVKSTGAAPAPVAAPSNIPRPPAPIPVAFSGARRVAAVQRALTEYGYGQLKATGTVGTDTQAAIVKFERERKLPVTGQVSDRLVRELTAVIGHPID